MPSRTSHGPDWRYLVWRGFRWGLPALILWLVLQQIDLAQLTQRLRATNVWLVALGISGVPLTTLMGALRWYAMLAQSAGRKAALGFLCRHYWIGLSLGLFTPASLGWDAYRVVVSGRYLGHFTASIAIIVVEKLLGLLTCAGLVLVLSPLIRASASPHLEQVLSTAYGLFYACAAVLIVAAFGHRQRTLALLLERLEAQFRRLLASTGAGRGGGSAAHADSFRARLALLLGPRRLAVPLLLTVSVQVLGAVTHYLFFIAIGHPVPLLANLFVTPVLTFVFLLPVSFGGIGVREGAFVLLYSLFGVPAEAALLVSLFSFLGIVLNNAIGGLLLAWSNLRPMPRTEAIPAVAMDGIRDKSADQA